MNDIKTLPDGREYVRYNAAMDVNGNKVCKVWFADGHFEYIRDTRMPIGGHDKFYSSLNGLYRSK